MKKKFNRRKFLIKSGLFFITASSGLKIFAQNSMSKSLLERIGGARLKISCNLYSFNRILRSGEMSLEECLEFCAKLGFDAVDITGYYIKGYPTVPPDDYLYSIKRKCHLLGLDISGTGVRNDFTLSSDTDRKKEIQHVKDWIEVAAKIGAPVMRVFSGQKLTGGQDVEQIRGWVIDAFKECAEFGKKFGIITAVQNHVDFIQTSDDVLKIMQGVNSKWFGLVLDIGSYRTINHFQEIADTIPFAVSWQIKENMYIGDKEFKTDLKKLFTLIKKSDYRGYIPIETLGEGDPREKVPIFLNEVREALSQT
jgi:sugar phosphate isomerase/epimerase